MTQYKLVRERVNDEKKIVTKSMKKQLHRSEIRPLTKILIVDCLGEAVSHISHRIQW